MQFDLGFGNVVWKAYWGCAGTFSKLYVKHFNFTIYISIHSYKRANETRTLWRQSFSGELFIRPRLIHMVSFVMVCCCCFFMDIDFGLKVLNSQTMEIEGRSVVMNTLSPSERKPKRRGPSLLDEETWGSNINETTKRPYLQKKI